jgi:hypothetical protein
MDKENWLDTEPILEQMADPESMTPSDAKNASLIVAAQLSRARGQLGGYRAIQAEIKAELLGGGNKISEIKILSEATDNGKDLVVLEEYILGLDEVLKALKKSMAIMHEEVRGNI